MKLSSRTNIITIIISLTLFVVGLFSWNYFFMLTLPVVGDLKYQSTSLNQPFTQAKFFAMTLALIPISTKLIWKFAHISITRNKVLTICIIILAITVSVAARREMIKFRANEFQPISTPDYSNTSNLKPLTVQGIIPVSEVKFELFAFVGLITGSIISYFSLRQKLKG